MEARRGLKNVGEEQTLPCSSRIPRKVRHQRSSAIVTPRRRQMVRYWLATGLGAVSQDICCRGVCHPSCVRRPATCSVRWRRLADCLEGGSVEPSSQGTRLWKVTRDQFHGATM
ncbi:hypothetical protein GN956_G21514 [Arapaima gigas]